MGKKINPKILRMGVIRTWPSKWYSSGDDYIKKLEQDVKIRKYLIKTLREAGVDKVIIERSNRNIAGARGRR